MCLAVPGRVAKIYDQLGTTMADVEFGTVTKQVCLAYLPETRVGEYVIVHVGFAIQRLDEVSAQETLKMFDKLGILVEEFDDGFDVPAHEKGLPA